MARARPHEVTCHRERLDVATTTLAQNADVAGVFVKSHLGASVLDKLPRLRLIANHSTAMTTLISVGAPRGGSRRLDQNQPEDRVITEQLYGGERIRRALGLESETY